MTEQERHRSNNETEQRLRAASKLIREAWDAFLNENPSQTEEVLLEYGLPYSVYRREMDLRCLDLIQVDMGHRFFLPDCLVEFNRWGHTSLLDAIMTNIEFRTCVFERVSFAGADLRGAEFRSCDLFFVDFQEANLERANLERLNLEMCWFKGANLEMANIRQTILEEAYWLPALLLLWRPMDSRERLYYARELMRFRRKVRWGTNGADPYYVRGDKPQNVDDFRRYSAVHDNVFERAWRTHGITPAQVVSALKRYAPGTLTRTARKIFLG